MNLLSDFRKMKMVLVSRLGVVIVSVILWNVCSVEVFMECVVFLSLWLMVEKVVVVIYMV